MADRLSFKIFLTCLFVLLTGTSRAQNPLDSVVLNRVMNYRSNSQHDIAGTQQNVYIKYSYQTDRRNVMLNLVPTMYTLAKGERLRVGESYCRLTYLGKNHIDLKRQVSAGNISHYKKAMPTVLELTVPFIYEECLFDNHTLSPFYRGNKRFYRYTIAYQSEQEAVISFRPKLTNTQLIAGKAYVEVPTGKITEVKFEGEYDMIDYKVDVIQSNEEGYTLLPQSCHVDAEFPFVGNAAPPNAQRRDAILIKRAGFNFVRLSHYNQSPAFVDACDELGIAVMPAIPGWQHYSTNSSFVDNVYRDCRELVRTLRNHPSVIFWEVSLNESYPPAWLNAEMHRLAHEEYPGDQCYTAGDSIGNFEGWDVLFFHDRLKRPDKPALLREYGDWGFGGNDSTSRRNRGDGAAALLGQVWNFQWSLNLALGRRRLIGTNDWCFIDYNRGYHTALEESGSVDLFRVPKPKFHFYRSQGEKEPVLFAVRDGSKVVVFSHCDRVELRRGGETVAAKGPDDGPDTPYNPAKASSPDWETAMLWRADSSGGAPYDGGNCQHLPHPPFTFFGVPEGDLEAVGLKDGAEAARQSLREPGEVARVETVVRDEGVAPVEGDLVFVDAVLRDAAGTLVPAARTVRFSAEGCEIVGVSGNETLAGIASCLVRAGKDGAVRVVAALAPRA